MANSVSLELVVTIIGVIGTWIGVYFGYKAIKKNNEKTKREILNIISNNKSNTQIGTKNTNVQ